MSSGPTSGSSPDTSGPDLTQSGFLAAVAAYLIWGLFPLMFRQVEGVDATTIIAHRIVWALPAITLYLLMVRRLGEVRAALMDRKVALTIAVAAAVLMVNWFVFVYAVESHRVLETSFGYFINPIVNVLLGMVLLGERQNRLQWVAITLATIAIAIQWIGIGEFPVISIALAFSFGAYGFIRKTANVGSAPGLLVETMLMAPFAFLWLGWTVFLHGPGLHADPRIFTWLIITGPATALALILFAFGARQLRLTTIGFIQYLGPSIQFLIAVFLFHEELNLTRWASFGLVWAALMVFSYDGWHRRRHKPIGAI